MTDSEAELGKFIGSGANELNDPFPRVPVRVPFSRLVPSLTMRPVVSYAQAWKKSSKQNMTERYFVCCCPRSLPRSLRAMSTLQPQ